MNDVGQRIVGSLKDFADKLESSSGPSSGSTSFPPVLDACCGSRMFWFDSDNPKAVFVDKRSESHALCDGRELRTL